MDNQQAIGKVLDTELAWLAGMLNGDGCLSLQVRKREGRWKADISVTLTQTDPSIIEQATDIIVRAVDATPGLTEYEPSGAGLNTKYNLRFTRMAVILRLLEAVMPYMVGIKLAKAKLMCRYILGRQKHAGEWRRDATIATDLEALQTVKEFYHLCDRPVPKEISASLRGQTQRAH